MEELHRIPPKKLTYLQKALRRRYRFKREEAQHLRRQAHQNAARKARREPKFPEGWSKKMLSKPEKWEITCHRFTNKKSFHAYCVLRQANKVHFKLVYYPGLSLPSDDNKYFWIKVLRLVRWETIFQCVQQQRGLDLDNTPQLQSNLRLYVSGFFRKGVEYHVKSDYIFPTRFNDKQDHNKKYWGLYLGGWKYAEYHPDLRKTDPEEWKRREEKELNEIDRIFAEARQLRIKLETDCTLQST